MLEKFNITGRTFLDLGANVGFVTLAAVKRFDKVIAVEAHPLTFARLKANVGRKATLLNRAVSDVGNESLFVSSPKNSIGATVQKRKVKKEAEYYAEVKGIAINSLLEKYQPDVVKMDIEGYEYRCLPAINDFSHLCWLIVEFHGTQGIKRYKEFKTIERQLKGVGLVRKWPRTLSLKKETGATRTFFFVAVFHNGSIQ